MTRFSTFATAAHFQSFDENLVLWLKFEGFFMRPGCLKMLFELFELRLKKKNELERNPLLKLLINPD